MKRVRGFFSNARTGVGACRVHHHRDVGGVDDGDDRSDDGNDESKHCHMIKIIMVMAMFFPVMMIVRCRLY